MDKYIITGATGHVGNNIARVLLEMGADVTLLVRRADDISLDGLAVAKLVGDITDPLFLARVITTGSIVIHSAGVVDIIGKDHTLLNQVNIEGTKNIVDAAIANRAKKLIYIGSVDGMVRPKTGKITEPLSFEANPKMGYYGYTKAIASSYILEKIANHELDACILCPSAVIGPYDFKVSNVGQAFLDCIDHRLMARFKGGYNFIDARDIGKIILNVAQNKTSPVYLLTGTNVSIDQLFQIIYQELDRKHLPWKFPFWLIRFCANFTNLYYRMRGVRPVFTKKALITLAENHDYDNSLAIKELNLSIRPVEDSIIEAIHWLKAYKNR